MKPIEIVMSAFGSYAKEERISFAQVQQGIFLITGDTGAGKTTVFDAIAFALYGETSGAKREGSMMRSQLAADEQETYVELTFEEKGEQYTIYRKPAYYRSSKKKNRDGVYGKVLSGAKVSLILPDKSEYPGKIAEVNARIQELVGVDQNQFSQLAMIAQGEYLKLLHASSRERREIFSRIFPTEIYRKVQQKLKEQNTQLYIQLEDSKKAELREKEWVVCEADSEYKELWEKISQDTSAAAEETTALIQEITRNFLTKLKELEQQEELLHRQMLELEKQQERENELEENERQSQALKQSIEQQRMALEKLQMQRQEATRKLQEEIPAVREAWIKLKEAMPRYEKITPIQQEAERLEQSCRRLENSCQQRQKTLREQQKSLENLQTEEKALENSTAKLAEYTQEVREREEKLQRLEELQGEYLAWERDSRLLLEQRKRLLEQEQKKMQAWESYQTKNLSFIAAQAGILAAELLDGAPCPVCGSLKHPNKAKLTQESVSKEEVEQANREFQRTQELLQNIAANCEGLRTGCEKRRQLLERDGAKLLGKGFLKELEREEPDAQVRAKIENYIGTKRQQMELTKTAQQEEQKRQRRFLKVREEKEKLEPVLAEGRALLEQEQQKLQEQQLLAREKHTILQGLREQLPLPDEQAAREKIQALAEQIQRAEDEANSAEKICQQYLQKLNEAQGREKEQQKRRKELLAGLAEEDFLKQKTGEKISECRAQYENCKREKSRILAAVRQNQEAEEHFEQLYRKRENLSRQYQVVNTLYKTANGKLGGSAGLDFQTYMQRQYFNRMIHAANKRLLKMTDGQLKLQCRELENLGKQGEVGLDLDVYSVAADKVRDVKTLSGGESFLAALSMALGMADVIQKTAGSIHIDTLFIDEGFGSLDEASRGRAIRILQELAGEKRLIGIISHVTELKEQMGRRLVVEKSEKGSRVHWEVDE